MKKNKGKIFLWICIEVILATTFIALCWSPLKNVYSYPREDDVIATLSNDSVAYANSCEINENGQVTITGEDAYIVFSNLNYNARNVAVCFKNEIKQDIPVQLFVDYGNGYNQKDSYSNTCHAGQKLICLSVSTKTIYGIRIDIDSDYELEQVELHKNRPVRVYVEQKNKVFRLAIGVILSLIVLLMLINLDKKQKLSDRVVEYIHINRIKILFVVLVAGGAVLLQKVLPISGFKFVMIIGIGAIVFCFIYEWKRIKDNPEYLFVEIILIVGSLMILEQPLGHTCWDLDSHYKWVLESTSFGDSVITNSDTAVMYNHPKFLAAIENVEDNYQKIDWVNKNGKYAKGYFSWKFSLPHMMNGVAIAILRLLGVNFYWLFTLGKFPSLLIYALVCFLGIKKLKSGKMIFATIALFPTNIYLACNYTYDYWVICFSLLGMAYFVGCCQDKEKIVDTKECIIMCGAFALACLPKLIYAPFLFIPFLMPKKKIGNKKKYYTICVLTFIVLFIFLFIQSIFITTGTGDLRGGDVNPGEQIHFILSNLMLYANILFEHLKIYLSVPMMDQYISHFAYLGIGQYSIIFKIVLLVTMFTDKNEYDKNSYSVLSRLFVIIMYFGLAALISTALYISFTPVGANGIGGCQPRYIIPLVYPVCSILFGRGLLFVSEKIGFDINRKIYNYIIFLVLTGVLYYDIYGLMYLRVR